MMEPQGYCVDAFATVREAFQENFATDEELGASACVVHDGEVVVDLWGGSAAPSGEPWQQDTIVNVYSTTKTMAAVCMLMLADRGLIDFDAPVAPLLAGVRPERQGGCPGSPRNEPLGRVVGFRLTRRDRGTLQLG